MELTEIEKTELFYAISRTEDFYKEQIENLLEIEKEEDVTKGIKFWEKQLQTIRNLEAKILYKVKTGEL